MADDADAADAEQRRAAVLGIIDAFLEIEEGAFRQDVADLAGNGGLERLAEEVADHLDETLADLEGDVADEAVADDHVDVAAVDVAAFDVADVVQVRFLRRGAAARVTSLPLWSSSPMESRPTRGWDGRG